MPLDLTIQDDVYFSETFKVIVRSCKEKLLSNAKEIYLDDKSFMYAHRNNFYAFLRGIGVDERLIWPTAFINDITNPLENFTDRKTLFICTIEDLDQLLIQLKTTRS